MRVRKRHGALLAMLLALNAIVWLEAQDRAVAAAAVDTAQSWTAEVSTSVRAAFSRLGHSLVDVIPRLIAMSLTLLVFWGLATLARWLARRLTRRLHSPTLRMLAVQTPYVAVWAIGAVAALDTLGFDVQSIVTGFGLTGVVLGFALRDVMSNMVSGVLILLTRTFALGDQIAVGTTEGTVERIEARATHIRTYDGRLVLVPNAEILTSRVINNTASPLRRASIVVLIDYEEDLELAMHTMDTATRGIGGVAAEPAPIISLADLTPEHFAIETRFWTDARRPDFMIVTSNVRAAIVQALKASGVRLPNPDRRLLSPDEVDRWRDLFAANAGAPLS